MRRHAVEERDDEARDQDIRSEAYALCKHAARHGLVWPADTAKSGSVNYVLLGPLPSFQHVEQELNMEQCQEADQQLGRHDRVREGLTVARLSGTHVGEEGAAAVVQEDTRLQ